MAKKSQFLPKLILVGGLTLIAMGGFFVLGTKLAHAEEGSFTTLAAPVVNPSPVDPVPPQGGGNPGGNSGTALLAVSNEVSTSVTGVTPTAGQAVSAEARFTTLGPVLPSLVISGEISATTTTPGGCTANCGGNPQFAISDEIAITTGTPPGGCTVDCGGGGCTINCGGGCVSGCGGGGGGGFVNVFPPNVPTSCPVYLEEYIKEGAANNPWEVLKLQLFLHNLEGESGLQLTGVYDAPTVAAVRRFQLRLNQDVLRPWGISGSTGYVFITTKLAINNIVCGRPTANGLDLRRYYPTVTGQAVAKEAGGNLQIVGTPDYTNTLAGGSATSTFWHSLATGVGAIGPSLPFWIALLIFLILLLLMLVLTRHWGELSEAEPTSEDLDNGPPELGPIDEVTTDDHALTHEDEILVDDGESLQTAAESNEVRTLPLAKESAGEVDLTDLTG